jgi:hypothetical protein
VLGVEEVNVKTIKKSKKVKKIDFLDTWEFFI